MKYCDNTCEDARWPDKLTDGAKSCMTFTALYCVKLGRLVYKNSLCEYEKEKEDKDSKK
ncbi:MAG: hypothetical protein P9X24_03670 [Candidatus Hatepunaea meridiana]|nr:hypothetical protein [Candidatus Hatepunaea meridiana]